jgi:hypothetical protein
VDYNNEDRRMESVYSQKVKAGKKRTYFFDVRTTRNNDYYLTITESKRRFNGDGYERHKIFIYKEDFNKFVNALTDTVNHVKTELMPDFDFDAYNHDYSEEFEANKESEIVATVETISEETKEIETEKLNPVESTVSANTAETGTTSIHTEDAEKW